MAANELQSVDQAHQLDIGKNLSAIPPTNIVLTASLDVATWIFARGVMGIRFRINVSGLHLVHL